MSKRVKLPDGSSVYAANALDVRVVYREIFVTEAYFRHGITLPENALVIDAGANVGMLGLYLARRHPSATVHMFEPIPSTFEMLALNLELYPPGHRAFAYNLGLSDRSGDVEFQLDPELTFAASMSMDTVESAYQRGAGSNEWTEAVVLDLPRTFPDSAAARWLAAGVRGWTRPIVLGAMKGIIAVTERAKTKRVQRVLARVVALSDFLREKQIDHVDLLKVDVEGAEVAVLDGIAPEDWAKIDQVVIEVHDVDGRADAISQRLRGLGYHTVIDPEDWEIHRMMGITSLFARRV